MSDHPPDNARTRLNRHTVSLDAPTRFAPTAGGEAATLPATDGLRYALKYEIASGGMGHIFLAEDVAFRREVAVKILRDDLRGNAAVTARFLDEAVITGQLQHPAIPPVHDLGALADGRPFLVMKLIKGHTLSELLADGARASGFAPDAVAPATPTDPDHPRPAVNLMDVFEHVCQAVGYAHERGVIHRDLKPSNVMVGAFGEVQLMDWGLAKVLANPDGPRTASDGAPSDAPETEIHGLRGVDHTKAGSVFGTPGFMPPEQAWGHVDQVDRRSDVFGLGALLCVLLTGRPPYHSDDTQVVKLMSVRGDVGEAHDRLDGCGADPELIALAKRCLSAAKADRPADGGEVAAAVGAYRMASKRRAREAEVAAARAVEQRKRAGVWAAFAVITVGLAAAAGSGWMWVRAERHAEQARVQAESRQETAAKVSDTCITLAYRLLDQWRIRDADLDLKLCEQAVGHDLPPDARDRLTAARNDAAFAASLDAIRSRFNPAEYDGTPEPYHEYARREYRAAFRDHGFDNLFADPPATVARLKASPISRHLLAALDNWMFNEPDRALRVMVWMLTSGAGKESWRLRVAIDWRTPEAVKQLLADTPPADRTPALYDFVGSRLEFLEPEKDTGRAVFLQGSTQHPDDPWLYYKTAVAHARRRDYPKAVTALRTMLAIRPESAYGWRTLAWMQRVQGFHPAAAAAAEKALALDPADWRAHLELALATYPTDRRRARVEYAESAKFAPASPWPLRYRGQSELNALHFAEAAAAYREAVRRDPKQRQDHIHAGYAAIGVGEWGWADEAYRGAVKLNAKDKTAVWGLAILAVRAGDRTKALELAATAADKPMPAEQLHEEYVTYLLATCTPPVAAGMWAGAAAKHPDDPHAAFVLGLIHYKQGRFADAARELARADALGRTAAGWPYPTARWSADAAAKAKPAK
jgi:serine/threonine protein kinase/Flp pilus assembly protein TadD